jgi:hypothetical protein
VDCVRLVVDMKFEMIAVSYENVVGITEDGKLVYISKDVLKKTDFKGKLIKKRTRTWLE